MRLGLMAVAVGVCIAGAAIAQEQIATRINWDERPSARDFFRAYPDRARESGVAGYSLLCCAVTADRRLACDVAVDWPSDQGFAAAAQRVARKFRMSEESFAAYRGSGRRVRHGIVWQGRGAIPELSAALAQIHEATRSTCMPPGAEAEPGVDDIVVTTRPIS